MEIDNPFPPFQARSPFIDYSKPYGRDNSEGMTELTQAIIHRNMPVVRNLSKHIQNVQKSSRVYDDQKRIWRWETPLITAARMGILECVVVLIEAGGPVDTMDQTVGKSALHWACNRSNTQVAKYLISQSANVNKSDFYMETPICEAIAHRNFEIFALLVVRGVKLDVQLNYDRDTALLFALFINEIEMAKDLMKAGANVNVVNREGDDPLGISVDKFVQASQEVVHVQSGATSQEVVHVQSGATSQELVHVQSGATLQEVVHMVLLSGFRVLEKHMNLTARNKDAGPLLWLVQRHYTTPHRLANLCRNAVRNVLLGCTNNTTIIPRIDRLPLPAWLISYVKFDQI